MTPVNDPHALENLGEEVFDLPNLPVNKPVIAAKSSVQEIGEYLTFPQVKTFVIPFSEGSGAFTEEKIHVGRFSAAGGAEALASRSPRRAKILWPISETSVPAGFGERTQEKGHSPADDDLMTISREEIDAKLDRNQARLEATEARIDASLQSVLAQVSASEARLQGSLDVVAARLEGLPKTGALIAAAATTGVTVVGLIVGILSWGGDRFDGGVQVTSASVEQALEAKRVGDQNAEQLRLLTTAVESLATEIKAVSDRETLPQTPPKQ